MVRSSQYLQLEEAYDRGDTVLVFPSEVAASLWRRALVGGSRRRAIRSDRVLSWDIFKEQAIAITDRRRPVSRMIRSAFAELLIEENGAERFLSELIEPAYAQDQPGVSEGLVQLFPRLPALFQELDQVGSALRSDYREIDRRYRRLLDQYGLFEPNWELHDRPNLDRLQGTPILVWPELLEDYHEYRDDLGEVVETIPLPHSTEGTEATYREYPTSRDELADLFSAIETDLDRGIPPAEIAVTVADLENVKPWVNEYAARRGIAIRYGAGESVSEQPGGRFFTRIDEVVQSRFSVVELASLLYERSLPWNDPGTNDRLLRFGYKTHCYSRAEWRRAIGLAASLPDKKKPVNLNVLGDRYRRLESDISAIVSAKLPSTLRNALRRFLANHIAPPGAAAWDDPSFGASQRVYETAQKELTAMCDLEAQGIPIRSPWRFFLSSLAARRYVPRQTSGGIPVFPYRVAAGIPVQRHYVIGLSQTATRVRPTPPFGLRTDVARRMKIGAHDRTGSFLNAYIGSVGNGICSSAVQTPAGVHVPAPELAGLSRREGVDRIDLWNVEREWWRNASYEGPQRLYPRQRGGLARAIETTLSPVGLDFQNEVIPSEVLNQMPSMRPWSPTTIDRYNSCPFSFFFREILGVREKTWGFQPNNRLQLGTVAHTILTRIVTEGVARTDDLDTRIDTIISEVFGEPETQLYLPRVAADRWKEYLRSIINTLWDDPTINFAVGGPTEWEIEYTTEGFSLTGKIDRVVDDTDTVGIVDYKLRLGEKHRGSNVFPGEDGGIAESSTIQLPVYVFLYTQNVPRQGVEVDRVSYVDLTSGTVQTIADRTGDKRRVEAWERMQEIVAALPYFLSQAQRSVASGDLRCQEEPDCTACGIRGVCRSCFVTRRFTDEV